MPGFKVPVRGKDLVPAKRALDGAGIETFGPGRLSGVLGRLRLSHGMTALLLDAATAREAEDRVRNVLPADGYTVGPAKPR